MRGLSEYKTSAVVLIAANALPIFGLLFLGWDTFSIIVLYWVENVIIGMMNILKMIVVNPRVDTVDWAQLATPDQEAIMRNHGMDASFLAKRTRLINQTSKILLIPFFAFHYGFFCLVHGFFVFGLFSHAGFGAGLFGPLNSFADVLFEEHMWWCVIALAASHLCSFVVDFIGRGEYRRTAVLQLMMQPYSRILVLQIAIIFGGFVAMALGSNAGVLMILVVGKTVLDLGLHLRERDSNATSQPQRPPIMPDVIRRETIQSPAKPAASER